MTMETKIKKVIKAGNSSAVILPRAWLNQKVRVELIKKTNEDILYDTIKILHTYIDLSKIIGIYVVGSYARGEEDEDSDIDILVITDGIDKKMIVEGIYNVLIVSFELLMQKLKNDLFPVGQMIKEAKPLMNSLYLEQIDVKVTKKNIQWYLKTTKEKIKLVEKIMKKYEGKKYTPDSVAYTLVLRIRTLYTIKCLRKNKNYSKKDFIELVKRVSGAQAYESYLIVKNNLKGKNQTRVEDAKKLNDYLINLLKEVEGIVN